MYLQLILHNQTKVVNNKVLKGPLCNFLTTYFNQVNQVKVHHKTQIIISVTTKILQTKFSQRCIGLFYSLE